MYVSVCACVSLSCVCVFVFFSVCLYVRLCANLGACMCVYACVRVSHTERV